MLLLGDPKSGKSTFLRHYTQGIYHSSYNPSSKIEMTSLVFASPGGQTTFEVLDVPGSFTDLKICDHIDGAIIFVDLTSKDRHLTTWFQIIQDICVSQQTSIPIVICGNKDDSFSKRNDDDIVAYAEAQRLPYFRTSALTMYNFMKPFETLGKTLFGSDFELHNVPLIITEDTNRRPLDLHSTIIESEGIISHLATCGSSKVTHPYLVPIWPDQLFITSLSIETPLEQRQVWSGHEDPIFALEI